MTLLAPDPQQSIFQHFPPRTKSAVETDADAARGPRCAFCSEPLAFNTMGIRAWRAGERFFCNEYCAEGAGD